MCSALGREGCPGTAVDDPRDGSMDLQDAGNPFADVFGKGEVGDVHSWEPWFCSSTEPASY